MGAEAEGCHMVPPLPEAVLPEDDPELEPPEPPDDDPELELLELPDDDPVAMPPDDEPELAPPELPDGEPELEWPLLPDDDPEPELPEDDPDVDPPEPLEELLHPSPPLPVGAALAHAARTAHTGPSAKTAQIGKMPAKRCDMEGVSCFSSGVAAEEQEQCSFPRAHHGAGRAHGHLDAGAAARLSPISPILSLFGDSPSRASRAALGCSRRVVPAVLSDSGGVEGRPCVQAIPWTGA
jgi:hypothetical protein